MVLILPESQVQVIDLDSFHSGMVYPCFFPFSEEISYNCAQNPGFSNVSSLLTHPVPMRNPDCFNMNFIRICQSKFQSYKDYDFFVVAPFFLVTLSLSQ